MQKEGLSVKDAEGVMRDLMCRGSKQFGPNWMGTADWYQHDKRGGRSWRPGWRWLKPEGKVMAEKMARKQKERKGVTWAAGPLLKRNANNWDTTKRKRTCGVVVQSAGPVLVLQEREGLERGGPSRLPRHDTRKASVRSQGSNQGRSGRLAGRSRGVPHCRCRPSQSRPRELLHAVRNKSASADPPRTARRG